MVEVREAVVHQHWRVEVVRYTEPYVADLSIVRLARFLGVDFSALLPPRRGLRPWTLIFSSTFEGGMRGAWRHLCKVCGRIRCLIHTLRIVQYNLLNLLVCQPCGCTASESSKSDLSASVEEEAADGCEYDTDGEEEGEDGFGGQYGPMGLESAFCFSCGRRGGKWSGFNLLPCFQPLLSEGGVCDDGESRSSDAAAFDRNTGGKGTVWIEDILAGLLLFCFFCTSGSRSPPSKDSVCVCVADMMATARS